MHHLNLIFKNKDVLIRHNDIFAQIYGLTLHLERKDAFILNLFIVFWAANIPTYFFNSLLDHIQFSF